MVLKFPIWEGDSSVFSISLDRNAAVTQTDGPGEGVFPANLYPLAAQELHASQLQQKFDGNNASRRGAIALRPAGFYVGSLKKSVLGFQCFDRGTYPGLQEPKCELAFANLRQPADQQAGPELIVAVIASKACAGHEQLG